MKETYWTTGSYRPVKAEQLDLTDRDDRDVYHDIKADQREQWRLDLQRTILQALAWRCGAKIKPEEIEPDRGTHAVAALEGRLHVRNWRRRAQGAVSRRADRVGSR